MRVRFVERRCRSRGNRSPTLGIENDYNLDCLPQYFQVTVNVLEARKLNWSNPRSPNSYVIVVLGKKKQRTAMRRNMEEPHYREYFVFDLCMSLKDIQRSSIWLAVMEPKCCAPPKLLGETTIDLGVIWAQPHHQVYHKWAQLSVPRDPIAGCVGFLKVDISIVVRGEVQIMPATVLSNQKLEDNLLIPTGSEQQRANYQITIYGAYGLPNGTQSHVHRRTGKPPSTFVRVSFCGLIGKTGVQARTHNPRYNEQVSIVEMFPNTNQTILIEVCSGDGVFNKILASTDLRLGQISHDGENGFLPTFGPSLLQMYSLSNAIGTGAEEGPYHRGSLLLALKTLVPYYQQTLRTVTVEPVSPIDLNKLWVMEDFCTYCPIFEVSMLDKRLVGKLCGVAISIGEISSDKPMDEEFGFWMEEIKSRKLHYTGSLEVDTDTQPYGNVEFPFAFPVLQLITRLPDFRFRMYRNNMIQGIVSDLEEAVENIEQRLQNFLYRCTSELMDELNKVLDDTSGNIMKFLDITSHSSIDDAFSKFNTDLDIKQEAVQKEEIKYISHKILNRTRSSPKHQGSKNMPSRKEVKFLLAESKNFTQSLKNVMRKTSDGWPDLVVWLLSNGSRVAYHKIPAADIIYSVITEQCGKHCGQIQTLYMKPLKCLKHMNTTATSCICIAGKIEIQLWAGLYRQKSAFEQCLPIGYRVKVKDYDMCIKSSNYMVECRAFIYRAKLCSLVEKCNIDYPFVRINVFNSVKETKRLHNTCTPLWNQTLIIQKSVFTTTERLIQNPPAILVEVFDGDLERKTELIGRVQIEPVVDDRPSFDDAPPLQWYDLYRGAEFAGKIMMSVQLLQVQEKFLKSTMYSSYEENYCGSLYRYSDEIPREDYDDTLPLNLIPKTSCYKVDVYWWGLREVKITKKPCVVLEIDELCIKSDVIADKKSSSNFPNGRTTQTFESPLNEACSPPLSIRLYDSSTFGRTLFLGTNVVKNPKKYLVKWLPKGEREASLKCASIKSFDFVQVTTNQVMIKKSNKSINPTNASERSRDSVSIKTSYFNPQQKIKRSNWKSLFSRNEPNEEEYTLLPVQRQGYFDFPKIPIQKTGRRKRTNETIDCWWLRFTSSEMRCNENKVEKKKPDNDRIKIYDTELEMQPEFQKFKDWCSTLKLYNGKKTGIPEKDEQLQCGFLKAGIAIYQWPPPENTVAVSVNGVDLSKGYFYDHPNNESKKLLVRVYVVKALNLKAKDFTGKSDPYIVLSCGKKHLGDRNNYVSNSTEPIFGRLFEFRSTLPEDYLLTISLYDYDAIPPDELIGSTSIDLEDRIYTKHKARVGLPSEYKLDGYRRWRDSKKPSAILQEICTANHLPPPVFLENNSVLINNVEYIDTWKETFSTSTEHKENLCLNLLRNWHNMPICGYHLVPEHVETRSLYRPDKQSVEQGKIQLWIDIFPLDANEEVSVTAPLDIDPRKTDEYELRVIVWTAKVDMASLNAVSGKISKCPDLVVKTWMGSSENVQYTDIHYNVENGLGKFNWRMIFHIDYMHSRKMLVEKEQGPFTEYHEYSKPCLNCQILDCNSGEVLGSLTMSLNAMSCGSKTVNSLMSHSANPVDSFEDTDDKLISLFSVNSVRAWWPLENINCKAPVGMIDLELDLVTIEQGKCCPVGFGRDPPNPILCPMRRAEENKNFIKKVFCHKCVMDKTAVIYITCAIFLGLTVIACAFSFLFPYMDIWWSVTGHRGHSRNNEGIIRTLYPVRA